MDFALLLVVATAVTGMIWAADRLLLRKKRFAGVTSVPGEAEREKEGAAERKEPVIVEWSRAFFPVLLVVLLLRSFLVEPFRIPSASMMPTLLVGDFILVNKFSYGIRLPVVNIKVLEVGAPRRGDVAVFRYPKNPEVDYIKRIVGLPGDRVAYRNKVLYINGERMEQEPLGIYSGYGFGGARVSMEDLGEVEHKILTIPDVQNPSGKLSSDEGIVVPEGAYFVMGDNRDNSNDSRRWGFVPEENLVGKAFLIWMSWDLLEAPPNWSRIGTRIE